MAPAHDRHEGQTKFQAGRPQPPCSNWVLGHNLARGLLIRGTPCSEAGEGLRDRCRADLRAIYGADGEFKSGSREMAVVEMFRDEGDLLVQMRTGGGKSLLMELSAWRDWGRKHLTSLQMRKRRCLHWRR